MWGQFREVRTTVVKTPAFPTGKPHRAARSSLISPTAFGVFTKLGIQLSQPTTMVGIALRAIRNHNSTELSFYCDCGAAGVCALPSRVDMLYLVESTAYPVFTNSEEPVFNYPKKYKDNA